MACLAAAACCANSSIMTRRLPPVDAFGLTFAVPGFGALVVVPAVILTHGVPPNPAPKASPSWRFWASCPLPTPIFCASW